MPVYCSDSRRDVSKEEATFNSIEIVQVSGDAHSEQARKDAIDELIQLLGDLDSREPYDVISLADEALRALETTARDSEWEAEVALRVLGTPWKSLWNDTHARCWAVKLLAEYGRNNEDALEALTRLLEYDIGEGSDHDSCCVEPVRHAARDALTKLQA